MIERRKDRRCAAAAARVVQATLRPGRLVTVVDLSAGGAQVQADCPLRPGHRVQIRLVTETCTVVLGAHIVRCVVWAIHPDEGVTYRGALRFDERCARLSDPRTAATMVRP